MCCSSCLRLGLPCAPPHPTSPHLPHLPHLPQATITEALWFSGRMRLPEDIGDDAVRQFVAEVSERAMPECHTNAARLNIGRGECRPEGWKANLHDYTVSSPNSLGAA